MWGLTHYRIRTKILIGFSVPILILLAIGTGVYFSARASSKNFYLLIQTHSAIEKANLLAKLLIDMETGVRGFIITGDEAFLEPYHESRTHFDATLEAASALVRQTPEQIERLERVQTLADAWQERIATPEIAARQQVNNRELPLQSVLNLVRQGTGKDIMDEVRMQVEAFVAHETARNAIRMQQAQDSARFIIAFTLISLVLAVGGCVTIAFLIANGISAPLRRSVAAARQIAVGNLTVEVESTSHDEAGMLAEAFREMIIYIRHIADVAQNIAVGNIHVSVTPRSDQDVLNQAFASTIDYIRDVAEVTERVSEQDLSVEVTPKSEHDVLNRSLQRMISVLQALMAEVEASVVDAEQQRLEAENQRADAERQQRDAEQQRLVAEQQRALVEQQGWLRTGQAELGNLLRGEQDIAMLAKNVVTYIAKYLTMQVGAFYLADQQDDDTVLRLTGSYAYLRRKGNRNRFRLGESLVGQAALERESIIYANIPADYMPLGSGLGKVPPTQVVVTPFLYEEELKGVLEFGSLDEISAAQKDFIEQAAETIGIAVHSVQTRTKMQELLQATQRQAEELQQQQEELRVSNEELEEQTQALRESEQQLHQQQEELRQTNEELAEQTNVLERQQTEMQAKNRALQEAQRLVEEKARDLEISSKYKSEFLANMSHELRTPLNSLLILSNLLIENREGNLTDKQIEFAQMINTSGAELLSLINEVLDLSKVEAGKMELNLGEMSLAGIASYVRQNFSHLAEDKKLTLTVEVDPALPPSIFTDRQRVEQVLKNFLSNAFKFTNQGEISVHITRPAPGAELSRSHLDPGTAVALHVKDTGIGIPADKQRSIFEAFQQADGTTSRQYGGTGLGLSISRELAKLLGGEIHLWSQEGQGSTFILYLPEVHSHECDVEAETIAERSQVSSEAGMKPGLLIAEEPSPPLERGIETIRDDRLETVPGEKSLLIIEDDADFAQILFELARARGFKGLVAGDGGAGLQMAYQYLPTAIILDIGLPGMDGWSVMEKLKVNPNTETIPVHIISAQDRSQKASKMGAVSCLTKPVSIDDLQEVFEAIEEHVSTRIKRILIVEDDDLARESLAHLLESDDVFIHTVATGQDTLDLLHQTSFDCMVLDLGLTDMSGFDLLNQIEAVAEIAALPVIIYTGKDLNKDEQKLLEQYAQSTIIKGVRSQERLLDEVTLFLHQVESKLSKDQPSKPRFVYDKDAIFNDKTVLLVDDDMRNIYALANVLDGKGLDVMMAENGKEALKLLEEVPDVNLILMDIMMPEMDGYETMRAIRKQERFQRLPIIALTAKAMKGDRQKCLEAGANDYLSKPIDTDKLLSLLRVWLY